ncbi:hypothetical protein JTE90_007019 [Oedothorax gibbosus]|uniref:Protein arginine methyltransferase NDUFAF7 n=1 Tax=Oedothorax gibbosus TaxID=931172 RepID=A0AAV6TPV1_9ARAC|nr:hypothetical protein JTE90_007019 [Oedothorax gibbosus]
MCGTYQGYYMSRDVFGTSGDFITSPEISQIFGELIGIWYFNEWSRIGQPQPLQLVEFGPGRGTLTDDILRVFSKLTSPSQYKLSVHFIEVSPHLRQVQMSRLCPENLNESSYDKSFITKYGFPITWHPHLTTVPEAFSLYLAHEFFDAMPILNFRYIISRNPTAASKVLIDEKEERDHIEVSPESGILLESILKRIEEDGGIALIADYGHMGTKTDTFRAFKEHKLHDPLKNPGEVDLTADVDFKYFSELAKNKAVVVGPVSQASFLKNMGADIRLEKLMQFADADNQKSLKTGYEMLTSPDQMGERFKFLALYPTILEDFLTKYPPAGFDQT